MRHVVITGGNKGLGLAQTRLFLDRGWRVSVVARTRGDLDAHAHDALSFVETDLAHWGDPSWLDAIHARTGRIDGLVNNAGMHLKKPVWDVAPAELRVRSRRECESDVRGHGPIRLAAEGDRRRNREYLVDGRRNGPSERCGLRNF